MPRTHPEGHEGHEREHEEEPDNSGTDQIPWKLMGLLMTVGALVIALIGGYVGAWRGGTQAALRDAEWRGGIRASLDQISFQIGIITKSVAQSETTLNQHEQRLTKIELTGSPSVARLQEKLEAMQKTLDAHVARTEAFFSSKPQPGSSFDPSHKQ